MIVVDVSIFMKLFNQEEDSEATRNLVDRMLEQGEGFSLHR
ncbi:hypothetical protein [Mesorhizobium australafricanum]|uniref:Uncharacterized protein n=1 Tax=Mesorhizobium australafricanum TaxID=3072311 RepID=A0ABU4X0T1_9HYPH|nr:hypothetical protein [Mesorhizobium sp. VK3E]MDX8441543.1 hypothetical protein [Mesorhizobium sp. VK3E]